MKKLDFYVFKAVVGPTFLAFAIAAFVGIGNEFREESSHVFVGAAIRVRDIIYLSALFLPAVLPYVLPAALLVGTLLGYGRLAERGEIVAMRASGVSLPRLLAPALVLAAFFTAACYAVQEQYQHRAMERANRFFTEELPSRVTIATLEPGIMHRFANWRVYFRDQDDWTESLYEVDIVRYDESHGVWFYHARRAKLLLDEAGGALEMYDGYLITPDNIRLRFDSQTLRVPSTVVEVSGNISRSSMSLSTLHKRERTLTKQWEAGELQSARRLRRIREEIAERWTVPFATLALAMVGAPLSLSRTGSHRGGRMQEFALGLIVFVLFYTLVEVLRPRVLMPLLSTIGRLWLANGVFFLMGSVLIFRLGRGR